MVEVYLLLACLKSAYFYCGLECFFPSLPSILPFLEPIVSGKPGTWTVDVAKKLQSYIAIWYLRGEKRQEADRGFDCPIIIESDGSVKQQYEEVSLVCDSPASRGMSIVETRTIRYLLINSGPLPFISTTVVLLPSRSESILSQGETSCRQIFSLVQPGMKQKVVVLEESDVKLSAL